MAELGQLVEEQDSPVAERDLAGPGEASATNQASRSRWCSVAP